MKRKMFFGTGTNSASATVAPQTGAIFCRSLNYTSPGAGTLKIYLPRYNVKANAAVSASTALVIQTDALGYVGGGVVTTNDYVLVCNSSGTGSQWYLQSVSNVGAVSASTVALTLGGNVYCAASDVVYLVRAADIVSLTVGAATVNNMLDVFVGFEQKPVHVVLAATGTCIVSGMCVIE